MDKMPKWADVILTPLISLLLAMIISALVILAIGESPTMALKTMVDGALGSSYGWGFTLYYTTNFIFTGLAVAVAYHASLFNIGGEGQLIVGAIGAAAAGILFAGLPMVLLLPLVLVAGTVFGALWVAFPAWLLYRFNINEILTTVLMNFVAFELISYVAIKIWPDPAAGHPTTIPIGAGGELPMIVSNPPLHSGVIIALLMSVLVYIYTNRTSAGYELIATGSNSRASKVFGIKTKMMFLLSLLLGGAIAGLAGAVEVAGNHHRLIEGLQSNFLLLGIIIGLIAKGNNLAVPFVALFIAILEVGASAMQRTMQIPGEMVLIVEALILLFVLLSDVVQRRRG